MIRQLSGDRGRDHGRGHPNRDPSASDDRPHPTIYDFPSSSARALREGRGADVQPARSDSHGAQSLRAACDPLSQCAAGSRRQRAGLERL